MNEIFDISLFHYYEREEILFHRDNRESEFPEIIVNFPSIFRHWILYSLKNSIFSEWSFT